MDYFSYLCIMKVKILKNLRSNGSVESVDDDTFERQVNKALEEIGEVKDIKITSAYDESRYKVVITVMLIY